MKNVNFPRAGELHRRTGRQAALQDEPVDCTSSWAVEKSGTEDALFSCPPRPFPQSAGSPCTARWPTLLSSVQPASPPAVHVFHLETRSSSSPGPRGPLALQLMLSHFWIRCATDGTVVRCCVGAQMKMCYCWALA